MNAAFFTLDTLIAELERQRAEHGGTCQVGIDDADTGWELPIEEVTRDSETGRILLRGDYHGEEFPPQPKGDA